MDIRRIGWALALYAACLGLVLGLFAGLSDRRPAPDEAFGRVRLGMTREEVEAVVGPPRDCCGGAYFSLDGESFRRRGYSSWGGLESELLVLYGEDGTAVDVRMVTRFATGRRPKAAE